MKAKSMYRFIDDVEPTDDELKMIMHEVALEAKHKAIKTKKEISDQIKAHIREAQKTNET